MEHTQVVVELSALSGELELLDNDPSHVQEFLWQYQPLVPVPPVASFQMKASSAVIQIPPTWLLPSHSLPLTSTSSTKYAQPNVD